MTNQERAADVIYSHMSSWDDEAQAMNATQDLDDAGLLMPDPMKPDLEYVGGRGQNVAKWETGLGHANGMFSDGVGVFIYINQQKLSVSEARRMAHALLAAAKLAEEQE